MRIRHDDRHFTSERMMLNHASCESKNLADPSRQAPGPSDETKTPRETCRPETPARALDTLADRIRADAANDPVQYLLRSDTTHDGE